MAFVLLYEIFDAVHQEWGILGITRETTTPLRGALAHLLSPLNARAIVLKEPI